MASRKAFRTPALFVGLLLLLTNVSAAFAALTVTPITWDILGLDSNRPGSGPKYFPVGARVCTDTLETTITANLNLGASKTATHYITAQGATTLSFTNVAAGTCVDAYYEVGIDQVPEAYTDYRAYTITAAGTSLLPLPGPTGSTPVPRQLYVEKLVSQNRNTVLGYEWKPASGSTYTTVAKGGSIPLEVGQTYDIILHSKTSTGYNELETFINFDNTLFQILSVSSVYSSENSYMDSSGLQAFFVSMSVGLKRRCAHISGL